jgi:hypothetical protein
VGSGNTAWHSGYHIKEWWMPNSSHRESSYLEIFWTYKGTQKIQAYSNYVRFYILKWHFQRLLGDLGVSCFSFNMSFY